MTFKYRRQGEKEVTEKPSVLFTPKYRDLIQHARKLNSDPGIFGEIYFHPVEGKNKIIIKNIDLKSPQPLCEVNSTKNPINNQNWEEHWLEAYIINKSKKNNWKFDTSNKKFRFLSSQLRFRESCTLKIKGKYHVITDVLFYDSAKRHLVIWELKSNAAKKSFEMAMEELEKYCKELTRLFIEDETENCNAKRAYGLENDEISKVDGYVVLPKNDNNYETDQFGLYEYSSTGLVTNQKPVEPWKNYNRSMVINFELRNEPK